MITSAEVRIPRSTSDAQDTQKPEVGGVEPRGEGQGPVFAPDGEDAETDHIEKVAGDVVTYSYDSNRDLVTSVKNVWGPNPNPNRQGGVSVCGP